MPGEGFSHLHSTMLLLYQIVPELPGYQIPHLHSTMLLLYQKTSALNANLTALFTFHYASTLSRMAGKENSVKGIYIPLCFYFILVAEDIIQIELSIYIPLCFYFIPFLFSPLISCSSDLYFVHLLFSLYFHFKNILVKSPKCNFTLTVRALSTYWKFYTISSRQLQKVARFIIIYTPELFRNPLFISTFKNN